MHRELGLPRRVAAALENGVTGSRLLLGVAAAWGERARLATPLDWQRTSAPSRTLVTIGGATLGGDGKSRLALACVRFLAGQGARVALVGHAYRASPGYARVVHGDERVAVVGDEALVAARHLAAIAPVVVAPQRAAAVDLAFGLAEVVVLDGPVQVAPVRASLAVLVQSADAPWGAAGRCPPCGDLRASRERLLASSDLQVLLPDAEPEVHLDGEAPQSLASFAAGRRASRIGLFTALARPGRLVERLARAGLVPQVHLEAPDHGGGRAEVRAALLRLGRQHRLDVWLATDKCSSSLTFPGLPARDLGGPVLARMVPRPEVLAAELATRLRALLCKCTTSPTVSTWSATAHSS